jgi:hypothetical protein
MGHLKFDFSLHSCLTQDLIKELFLLVDLCNLASIHSRQIRKFIFTGFFKNSRAG